jgi:hypothetical protein
LHDLADPWCPEKKISTEASQHRVQTNLKQIDMAVGNTFEPTPADDKMMEKLDEYQRAVQEKQDRAFEDKDKSKA